MKKWIRMVSMCGFTFLIFLLSPVMTATTVYAGTVLTAEEESVPAAKLNVQAKSMVTDSTFNLRVYNLTEDQKVSYKSSNPEVVSVSKDGTLTANSIGSATITVTLKDSNNGTSSTLTCDVTVGPPAISIKLTLNDILMEVGKKTSLKAILKPNTTTEIAAYYSIDPEVATVSATGKVTAKSVGETVIYAEIKNGKYDKCVITVAEASTEDMATEESSAYESGSEEKNTGDLTKNDTLE